MSGLDHTILVGLAGAVGGGVAGAVAAHVFKRAKPKIGILDIFFDPMQSDDKRAMATQVLKAHAAKFFITPRDVIEVMKANDYVNQPETFYQHPSQYTWYLYETNRDNESVRLLHEQMPRVVQQLRQYFNTGMMQDFLALWAEYNRVLWGELRGHFVRGDVQIDNEVLDKHQETEPTHGITRDQDGDYFVNVGRYRINIVWSTDRVHQERLEPFAKKVAYAFGFEDQASLERLLDFVQNVRWQEMSLDRTAQVISRELRRFERLVVRGVVCNAGRSPMAVSGACKLRIASKNFVYTAPASGATSRVEGDIPIEMICVDDGYLNEVASLRVEAGGVAPFTAISRKYVHEMSEEPHLRALYGSERDARLECRRLDDDAKIALRRTRFRMTSGAPWVGGTLSPEAV